MTEHMKRLKEETKEYIMDLFERYVEQGLLFVNKKCVQAMPQVRNKIYVSYTVLVWYVRGDVKNSLAAAPIFSNKLQPTYIGKAIHSC